MCERNVIYEANWAVKIFIKDFGMWCYPGNSAILTNFSYREVAYAHRILEEPLEAGGPAGHALLRDTSMAAPSWKTAVAVQAALAAASLQLDSTVICKASSMPLG